MSESADKKEQALEQKRKMLIFDFSKTSWNGDEQKIGTLASHMQKFGPTQLIGYQDPKTGHPVCAGFIMHKNIS